MCEQESNTTDKPKKILLLTDAASRKLPHALYGLQDEITDNDPYSWNMQTQYEFHYSESFPIIQLIEVFNEAGIPLEIPLEKNEQ